MAGISVHVIKICECTLRAVGSVYMVVLTALTVMPGCQIPD